MNAHNVLIYLSLYFGGNRDKIYKELKTKSIVFDDNLKEKINNLDKTNAITLLDHNYPQVLKTIDKPPFVLYYRGNINLLTHNDNNHLAIIGSRNNTSYGKKITEEILTKARKETVVVSGLAYGIDSIAHRSALKNNLKTIAILGSGINNIYPKEHNNLVDDIESNNGLILSEYPDNVEPNKDNFLMCNRIIAALSKCVLVIESYNRSGVTVTINAAINQGKNIACIPGLANKGSNCNKFIKEGAYLVENAEDINDLY